MTTASDVYALGVLLYEMVTGQRPYEIEGLPLDQVLAVVLDTTPPKPSTTGRRRYAALSSSSAEAPSLPYDRRRLRGDLDAIVLKALAKEPERRYASAGELLKRICVSLVSRSTSAVREAAAARAAVIWWSW